jgi:hypothetical protein
MCVASIQVRQRCTQTAWHGGCEQWTNTCSQAQVNQIGAALCNINARVNACTLRGLTNLKNTIRNAFQGVVWVCGSLPAGVLAQTNSVGGNEITLSPSAFASTASRFEAIVFHELVHHAGGTELDAEAFENHCYAGSGATAPTDPDDFDDFRANGGNFVTWNQTSGQLTTTAGDTLTPNFIDPTPPSGGGGGGWI